MRWRPSCWPPVPVGCGGGWATIALAQAFPQSQVVGFDIDPPSVEMGRAAAAQAGSPTE